MTREFYNQAIRPHVKSGDIILFRGRRLLARTIQFFDNARYNHIGVVYESLGRFFIIDSNANGVRPDFLSERCLDYVEVAILRPNEKYTSKIHGAIESILALADEKIKYDFLLLPRIAIARKLGIDLLKLGNERRDICSEWARRYASALGATCYDNGTWITPQDFIRLANGEFIRTL